MVTTQALENTISQDPHFNLRIQYLLSKVILSITKTYLENSYIETFRLDFSPLIHCNMTEKAIVISTVPNVIALSRLYRNTAFANMNTFIVKIKNYIY